MLNLKTGTANLHMGKFMAEIPIQIPVTLATNCCPYIWLPRYINFKTTEQRFHSIT